MMDRETIIPALRKMAMVIAFRFLRSDISQRAMAARNISNIGMTANTENAARLPSMTAASPINELRKPEQLCEIRPLSDCPAASASLRPCSPPWFANLREAAGDIIQDKPVALEGHNVMWHCALLSQWTDNTSPALSPVKTLHE
ncbi:hypothetical protein [Xenorhabdus bovienii]|uniref:hypothetical protein n=1 Tax=Xenorhabdus bovienii TaxID=40576 RepID=UPI0023B2F663|nr:hypothetical protein [Xenorhabdus bovienii]MDE9543256.1 hypothetical protein [Xenorhabdus bovienii]